jgi:phosphoribosylanthranilate isomerase
MTLAIKICGLTNLDDARWAVEAGADFLGFVLYPKSPRYLSVKELGRIAGGLPGAVRKVGVFVNELPSLVQEVVSACGLAAVQLHGDEDPRDFEDVGAPLWRAIRLQDGKWMPDPLKWTVERYVMDAFSPAYGGTGMTLDRAAAGAFAAHHRAMLAGGLTDANVSEAIRRVKPLGVDVSSGVELSPGRKDRRKVSAFISAARAADEAMQNEE